MPYTWGNNMYYNNLHQIIIVDDNVKVDISSKKRSNEQFLKNHNYFIWDKAKITELMETNQDYSCLRAFNKFKPYAFKADLARYYILNKLGGWYSDLNNFQVTGPPHLPNTDMIVFRERLKHTETSWAVVNGYLYSKPNNPILDHAIESIIYNADNNFYGKHALYPTGPSLLGRSIACASFYEDINITYGDFIDHNNRSYFILNGKQLAVYKSSALSAGDVGHAGSNSYVSLWHGKDIYEKDL